MRYDKQTDRIRLPVWELCLLANRYGDLDLRYGAKGIGLRRAEEGKEAHILLERRRKEDGCEVEVPMEEETAFGRFKLLICGRADCIKVCFGEIPFVEEIKTVSGSLSGDATKIHESQGILYAWMLAKKYSVGSVEVRLTKYRASDGMLMTKSKIFAFSELERYVRLLLSGVAWRFTYIVEHGVVGLFSAGRCRFPYDSLREGQMTLLEECYRDIKHGKRLFAEAPTGIGKTISTLFPAVRNLGEENCDKIFYLTAKASTRREAFRAMKDIYNAGGHLRTIVLTSREQICPNSSAHEDKRGITSHCNPTLCPMAEKFYTMVSVALDECLQKNGFNRTYIEKIAKKYNLCPYELQLELSEFCDVVICDYNYVFDPVVCLRRYFGDENKEKYVFLVDEAHNLADRARGMYSASLSLVELETAWKQLTAGQKTDEKPEGREALARLIETVRGYRNLCREYQFTDENDVRHGYYRSRSEPENLLPLVEDCKTFLSKAVGDCDDPDVTNLYVSVKKYLLIAEKYGPEYLTFLERNGRNVTVSLICLDPSKALGEVLDRAKSAVFFSATLTPPEYFANILGGGRSAVSISLPSPFPRENFCITAVTGFSTRYEDREKNAKKVSACIAGMVSGRRGNYIVFFPSYEYLEKVLSVFREKYPSVTVIEQTRQMGQKGKEEFLSEFLDDGKLRVGFCVLGGSFSEGVDLPGGKLIGVMVIGVGLPGLSDEKNILAEYYDENGEAGYDYAYTYPGMNRVLQAVGRVIRREDDRGVAVLVDDRWGEDRFKMLFPEHWQNIKYAGNPKEIANIVANFWSSTEKKQENEI